MGSVASKLRCWLLPAFSHLKLKDLRRRHVEAYLTELRKTHSPASVNRHLTLLSAMFRRAIALDYLEKTLRRHCPPEGSRAASANAHARAGGPAARRVGTGS